MKNISPIDFIKYLSYPEVQKKKAKLLIFRSDPFEFVLNQLQKRSMETSFW